MKQRLALLGFGTVGQGLCEILLEKRTNLKEKYNYDFEIVAIADLITGNVYNPDGLDIVQKLKEAKGKNKFTTDLTGWDNLSLIRKSNATVVCEMTYTDLKTGGPAIDHVRTALESGKNVVTSNKGPAALAYQEMKKIAGKNGVKFLIEGTVMSGTPILNLTEGPLAGCEISAIRGILNGTTNYILSEMEKGLDYHEVLEKAQELGYAEADPTGDVEGYDARGKVTILANVVMEASLSVSDVSCKGITQISAENIYEAKKQNARWKLIGSIEKKS